MHSNGSRAEGTTGVTTPSFGVCSFDTDLESEESEDENVQYNINNNNFQDLQDRE